MALLETQDPLCLYAERRTAQVLALLEESLPDVECVTRWDVQLVGELPGEADPPDDAVGNPGHRATAHAEVREGIAGKVDTLHDALQERPAVGAGNVDAGEAAGHGGDVYVPLRVGRLQPVLEHLPDRAGTRRGAGHEPVVLAEAGGDAVIGDNAVLGHHRAVAHPADGQLRPLVDVHQLQELGDVRAAQVQLAEGGDVDQADVVPHVGSLGHRVAVVVRADPLACQERSGAMGVVPVLEGGATNRLVDATGQRTQRDGCVGRAPHGGADLGHGHAVGLGQHGGGVHRLQLALGRAHGHGGVPLHELDRVEALLGGLDEVLGGHVLREVDHAVG